MEALGSKLRYILMSKVDYSWSGLEWITADHSA